MKTTEKITRETVYRSEVLPDVMTTHANRAPIIAWADAHPTAWKVVRDTKSKAWGRNSNHYMGGAPGGTSPTAILDRLGHFFHKLGVDDRRKVGTPRYPPDKECGNAVVAGRDFFQWSARFTLDMYTRKGFTGGFFQQFDGTYFRACTTLDYTPETLPEVIRRFREWCETGLCRYETQSIQVDGRIVWEAPKAKGKKAAP